MTSVNEKMFEKIVESMEKNKTLPWHCPFIKEGLPYNFCSKNEYNGRNLLMLWCQNFNHSGFMTYLQAKKLGAQVKKGEHGTPIIYVNPGHIEENEEGKKELKGFVAKLYYVFNVSQIENLPEMEQVESGENLDVEQFIKSLPVKLVFGKKACYIPSTDEVCLPFVNDCETEEEYYSTAFHEIVHWTGKRMERDLKGWFGDERYSYEELVAELGSAFLRAHFKIDNPKNVDNSAAYLNSWLKALKEDKDMLFKACKDAEKAVDYLLTLSKQPSQTENSVAVATVE